MVYKKAREDFEAFAAGVKRLKELEKELNSLNTRNFKQEERDIRRKLKSVHLIPQIERDINELKARISGVDIKSLKAELDFEQSRKLAMLEHREEELQKEIKKAETALDKKRYSDEVKELEEKIYNLREDIYNRLVEETSESKWMIQKGKENMRDELKNLAKASVKLMQEEKEEVTGQLLEEINKLKKNIETNNKEIQQRITEIEARRNAEKFIKEHQQKVISRSQELGLKPKFLERIEHIDDSYNPISVKEINILSPFGVQQQKKKKEIRQESSFKKTEEIPELPAMPLSEEELKFSFNERFAPISIYPIPEITEEKKIKKTEFRIIKKEVENKIPSIPLKRENMLAFRERQEEPEEKEELLQKMEPRKIRVPNRKFLEEEKYNIFFDNLIGLRDLSFYNPEMFEEIKLLKEFQKNETEKSLENCEIIAKNLLRIRTKILTGIK